MQPDTLSPSLPKSLPYGRTVVSTILTSMKKLIHTTISSSEKCCTYLSKNPDSVWQSLHYLQNHTPELYSSPIIVDLMGRTIFTYLHYLYTSNGGTPRITFIAVIKTVHKQNVYCQIKCLRHMYRRPQITQRISVGQLPFCPNHPPAKKLHAQSPYYLKLKQQVFLDSI